MTIISFIFLFGPTNKSSWQKTFDRFLKQKSFLPQKPLYLFLQKVCDGAQKSLLGREEEEKVRNQLTNHGV